MAQAGEAGSHGDSIRLRQPKRPEHVGYPPRPHQAPAWQAGGTDVMQPPVAIDLPLPTSKNRMWRHGRGRVYLSPAYKSWIDKADQAFMGAGLNRGRAAIAGRFT